MQTVLRSSTVQSAPPRLKARPVSKIVVLNAAGDTRASGRYAIDTMISEWRALGVEVAQVFGPVAFVYADLVFVHVDRSVVSEAYLELARRYPLGVNRSAGDIRKHRYIDGRLSASSAYDGPVIVKTDLNYAGAPERSSEMARLRARQRILRTLQRAFSPSAPRMKSKKDYFLARSLRAVPRGYFSDEHVIQEFRPERDGADYILREYIFLGDSHYENVERSSRAIFEEDRHVSLRPFSPHPKLLETRRRLGLDYGKIDYTLVDGVPFILDANKTLGRGLNDAEEVHAMYRSMARRLVLSPAAAA